MLEDARSQVTNLLRQIADGKRSAVDDLYLLVYEDLKHVARNLMRDERAGHTLQPTALVNEAILRLLDGKLFQGAVNRRVFYGAAARAMRQVLVDHARQHNAAKRSGSWRRSPLDDAVAAFEQEHLDLLELDKALEKLGRLHQRQSEVVQLRFFGGAPVSTIAELLEVSQSTVEKDLLRAREFLHGELSDG